MSSYQKKKDFFSSEEGVTARNMLKEMVLDDAFNTKSSFSVDTSNYPDNLIPFVDKHMRYLRDHPNTNPQQYLSNLRLMTKIR